MKDVEWSYDDFIAFVMIYAAYADFKIVEEEKDVIVDEIGLDRYIEIYRFFRKNRDAENVSIIVDLKQKYIVTDEQQDELFEYVNKIIQADGVVNLLESQMKDTLNFLFEN